MGVRAVARAIARGPPSRLRDRFLGRGAGAGRRRLRAWAAHEVRRKSIRPVRAAGLFPRLGHVSDLGAEVDRRVFRFQRTVHLLAARTRIVDPLRSVDRAITGCVAPMGHSHRADGARGVCTVGGIGFPQRLPGRPRDPADAGPKKSNPHHRSEAAVRSGSMAIHDGSRG